MRNIILGGFMLAVFSLPVAASDMHPEVPILDAQGTPVIESGLPMSTMTSCGGDCHETGYIMANSDHADAGASQLGVGEKTHGWQQGPGYFGGWNPLAYDTDGLTAGAEMDIEAWLKRYGSRHVGGGPAAGLVEMDCLLCHTAITDHSARGQRSAAVILPGPTRLPCHRWTYWCAKVVSGYGMFQNSRPTVLFRRACLIFANPVMKTAPSVME